MKFNENGTISVEIDNRTYTLKRPTLGQLWEFIEYRDTLSEEARAVISETAQKMAELEDESDEFRELAGSLQDRTFVFRQTSEPWLRRAFEELGSKPLPENLDFAPAEIADPQLPNEIIRFWRQVPLASGRPRA